LNDGTLKILLPFEHPSERLFDHATIGVERLP